MLHNNNHRAKQKNLNRLRTATVMTERLESRLLYSTATVATSTVRESSSAIVASTTVSTLPAPVILSPGTSATPYPVVSSLTPTFTWTPVTPTNSITGYQLNLYDNTLAKFTSYQISGVSTSSFTIPSTGALTAGDSFVWNLRVVTAAGTGPESAYFDFLTPAPSVPPAVTGVSPASGSSAGGTSVTIAGTNLNLASGVSFGTVAATSFKINSPTSITAVTPAETAGQVDITVGSPEGGSTTSSADHFTFVTPVTLPAPTILSPGSTTTPYPVVGSLTPTFTWTPVTATDGITGYQLNLYDKTLGKGTSYQISGVSSSSFTIPSTGALTAGDTFIWNLRVVTASGTGPESAYFNFITPAPTSPPAVTGVSPASGSTAGGASVTITGTNLNIATSVSFGSVAATSFKINSPTSITAVSPAESAATVDITVGSGAGGSTASTADQFAFVAPVTLPAPTILSPGSTTTPYPVVSSLTPTFTWTPVTATDGITGYQLNLYDQTLAKFTTYQISGVGSSSFTIPSTAGLAPGDTFVWNLRVVTASGTGPESAYFYFVTPAPTVAPAVTGVSPATGSTAGGTSVTITGTNLNIATSVSFGSVAATSFKINSPTSITAVSPAESAATVDITVGSGIGSSTTSTADQFTFVTPVTLPAPTILSPGSTTTPYPVVGSLTPTFTWTPVTATDGITGYQLNLYDKTLGKGTSFQISGVGSSSFTIPSTAGLAPGDTFVWNLRVVTAVGTGPESAYFNFVTPASSSTTPQITGVSPGSGPTDGGTKVNITGVNFANVASVSFGGTAAASFTVNSPTSITAVSPAGSAGTVNIIVSGTDGTSGERTADRFTFIAPALPTPVAIGPGSATAPYPVASSLTPTLTWTPATPTNGIIGYQINLYDSTSKQFTSYQVSGAGSSSFTVPSTAALNAGDTYVWNVRALTSSQSGPPSTYLDFQAPAASSPSPVTSTPVVNTLAPALSGTLPTTAITGKSISLHQTVTLTNTTGSTVKGTTAGVLYLSTSSNLDASAIPLAITKKSVKVRTGKHVSYTIRVRKLSADVPNGVYYLVMQITDPTGGSSSVATVGTITVARA